MAIREVEVQHFRAQKEQKYSVSKRNEISGRNGAGKSSIKEALAFGFCGTDSLGQKNPQHLIRRQSDDKDIMKVRILTDKAEIQRTLSQKGNGSIKVIREGVPTTVTQTQLEGMIGPTDVVLSAMIPGYFGRLSSDRQNKALMDVLPAVDRSALFEELAGFPLSSEEKVRYGLSRRLDLIASAVATDRRELEKSKAQKEGELKGMMNIVKVDKPEEPKELADLSRLNVLAKEWAAFEDKMREYSSYKVKRERIAKENKERLEHSAHLKKILKDLKEVAEPEVEEIASEVQRLQDMKMPMPSPPAGFNLPTGDHCSTCGQVVGAKHREKVKKQNEADELQYKQVMEEARAFNTDIQDQINQLYQKENAQKEKLIEVQRSNRLVRQKKQQIEIELASLKEEPLPDVIEEPKAPEDHYDEDEHAAAQKTVEEFRFKEMQYAQYQRDLKRIDDESGDIKDDIKKMESKIERLMHMERAFKQMPEAEMNRQVSELKMKNIEFQIGAKIDIYRDGTPYDLLSTGYKMRSDIEICTKFNSLMKRPMNVIFIDDAELMDEVPEELIEDLQIFVARVDPEVAEVTVSEIG